MTKIICLNGPPGCGKDTIGAFLAPRLPGKVKIEKFARPIRDAAIATFPSVIEENFESMKDKPLFGSGPSLRQWMIDFSEKLLKPLYGEEVFGKLLLLRLQKEEDLDFVIVTDCGFFEEARILESYFGAKNLILFRIWRKGKTFAGDSRGYVSGIENTREITNAEDDPMSAVSAILEHLRWAGMVEI